jgi:hypothetical protein
VWMHGHDARRITLAPRPVRVFGRTAGGRVEHLAAGGGAMVHRGAANPRISRAGDYQADRQPAATIGSSVAATDRDVTGKARRDDTAPAITSDGKFLVWLKRGHERGLTKNCAGRASACRSFYISAGACAGCLGSLCERSAALGLRQSAQCGAAIWRAPALALAP